MVKDRFATQTRELVDKIRCRSFKRGQLLDTTYLDTMEDAMVNFMAFGQPGQSVYIDFGRACYDAGVVVDWIASDDAPVFELVERSGYHAKAIADVAELNAEAA